jgi:ABC-type dipeptide/oligopeptide/nickel transport system permease subunit
MWAERIARSGRYPRERLPVAGMIAGFQSGYRRGAVDAVFSRLADTILSFPMILLGIDLSGHIGSGLSRGSCSLLRFHTSQET